MSKLLLVHLIFSFHVVHKEVSVTMTDNHELQVLTSTAQRIEGVFSFVSIRDTLLEVVPNFHRSVKTG